MDTQFCTVREQLDQALANERALRQARRQQQSSLGQLLQQWLALPLRWTQQQRWSPASITSNTPQC